MEQERLLASDKEWTYLLSQSLIRLGDLSLPEDNERARKLYDEARELDAKLLSHEPNNIKWKRESSWAEMKVGDANLKQSQLLSQPTLLSVARAAYGRSACLRREILLWSPGNTLFQSDLAWILDKMGNVAVEDKEPAEARPPTLRRLESAAAGPQRRSERSVAPGFGQQSASTRRLLSAAGRLRGLARFFGRSLRRSGAARP